MLHGENGSVTFNLAVEVIDGAFSLAVEVINEILTPEVSHLIQCKMLYIPTYCVKDVINLYFFSTRISE